MYKNVHAIDELFKDLSCKYKIMVNLVVKMQFKINKRKCTAE